MKKRLYTFLLAALMVHTPLSAGNENHKPKKVRKTLQGSIQNNDKKKKRNKNETYATKWIFLSIAGVVIVAIICFASKNAWSTSPEIKAYKKWIEKADTKNKNQSISSKKLKELKELVKKETKDKNDQEWRNWIHIRNNGMINQLAEIYLKGEFDVSYVSSDEEKSGILYLGNLLENEKFSSLQGAYIMDQTLHLLDNIGEDKKKACISFNNQKILTDIVEMHGKSENSSITKTLDSSDVNTIPLIQALLSHGGDPSARILPDNKKTYLDYGSEYGFSFSKEEKNGKWTVSPKEE